MIKNIDYGERMDVATPLGVVTISAKRTKHEAGGYMENVTIMVHCISIATTVAHFGKGKIGSTETTLERTDP